MARTFTHERKKGTNSPPRYAVDEVFGDLAVTRVLEYGDRGMVKRQWWYEVQCTCGAIEEINQGQILAGRIDCQACMSDRKSRRHMKKTTAKATALPADVPDFARMRW